MSMNSWAENEVKIACARERAESKTPEGEWDYGCACYESALKAYKSLMEDGHSGFSISLTKQILVRLIEGKPLTPIEDTEDIWNHIYDKKDGTKQYQCKRMSALFKDIHPDGTVTYNDVDRCYCVYLDNPNTTWSNGLISRIVDEMFPIKMPYSPGKAIKVVCEEFLTDSKNGDYDTIGVLYAIMDDERVDVGRYFGEVNGEFVEITKPDYETRKMIADGWKQVND